MKYVLNVAIFILIVSLVLIAILGFFGKVDDLIPARPDKQIAPDLSPAPAAPAAAPQETASAPEVLPLVSLLIQKNDAELTVSSVLLEANYILLPLNVMQEADSVTVIYQGNPASWRVAGYNEIYNIVCLQVFLEKRCGIKTDMPCAGPEPGTVYTVKLQGKNVPVALEKKVVAEFDGLFRGAGMVAAAVPVDDLVPALVVDDAGIPAGLLLVREQSVIVPLALAGRLIHVLTAADPGYGKWLNVFLAERDGMVIVQELYREQKNYLQPGDVITTVNDLAITAIRQLVYSVYEQLICGDDIQLTVRRNNQEIQIVVSGNGLEEFPLYKLYGFTLIDRLEGGLPAGALLFTINAESPLARFGVHRDDSLAAYGDRPVRSSQTFVCSRLYRKPSRNRAFSIKTHDGYVLTIVK